MPPPGPIDDSERKGQRIPNFGSFVVRDNNNNIVNNSINNWRNIGNGDIMSNNSSNNHDSSMHHFSMNPLGRTPSGNPLPAIGAPLPHPPGILPVMNNNTSRHSSNNSLNVNHPAHHPVFGGSGSGSFGNHSFPQQQQQQQPLSSPESQQLVGGFGPLSLVGTHANTSTNNNSNHGLLLRHNSNDSHHSSSSSLVVANPSILSVVQPSLHPSLPGYINNPDNVVDDLVVEPTPIGPGARLVARKTNDENDDNVDLRNPTVGRSVASKSNDLSSKFSSQDRRTSGTYDNILYDVFAPTPLPPILERTKNTESSNKTPKPPPSSSSTESLPVNMSENPQPQQHEGAPSENPTMTQRAVASKTLAGLSGMYQRQQQHQQKKKDTRRQSSQRPSTKSPRDKIIPRRGRPKKSKSSMGDNDDEGKTQNQEDQARAQSFSSRNSQDRSGNNSDDKDDNNSDDDEGSHSEDLVELESNMDDDDDDELPIAVSARRNSKPAKRGRGRRRRRSSSSKKFCNEEDSLSEDDLQQGYGYLPIESRLRKMKNRPIPQTQLVIVNDEEPNRLTNPLLAMVPANFRKSQNDRLKKIQRDLQIHSMAQGSSHGVGRRGSGSERKQGGLATNSESKAGDSEDTKDDDWKETIPNVTLPFSMKATGTIPVEELMHSASIVFHKPDTYPISFLARLLGFDVDVPDACQLLDHLPEADNSDDVANDSASASTSSRLPSFPTPLSDPQTLPLLKDKMFLQIPPEGNFFRRYQKPELRNHCCTQKKSFGDWDDRKVLDYMDPIYKSFLQHGWEPSRCTAVPRIRSMKFIAEQKPQEATRQKVTKMAQELLGLSTDWTFQDWGSFQLQAQREEKEKEQAVTAAKPVTSVADDNNNNNSKDSSTTTSATIDSSSKPQEPITDPKSSPSPALGSSPHQRRTRQPSNGPLWTIDGNQVFCHMPQQVFGILASYKGEPITLLKYQFFWYRVPTTTDDNKTSAPDNSDEARQDELIMRIHGFCHRTTKSESEKDDSKNPEDSKEPDSTNPECRDNNQAPIVGLQTPIGKPTEGTTMNVAESKELASEANSQTPNNDKTGLDSIDDENEQMGSPLTALPIPTVEVTEMVKVVMLALALEHTRACGVFYGLWETPESLVPTSKTYFRMVDLPPVSDTVSNPNGVQPMICDLKKCSSRLALLRLKEEQDLKCPKLTASTSGELAAAHFVSSPERLLVEMPTFEKARTFFKGSNSTNSRQSKRGTEGKAASTHVFTGATNEARDVTLKLRAKIDTSSKDEGQVEVFRLDFSDNGCETEIPLRIALNQSQTIQETTGIETTGIENEAIVQNERDPVTEVASNENQQEETINWKLMRCFPIEDQVIQSIEPQNEVLDELKRKQDELIAIEKSLEPQVRGLLVNAIDERIDYELPESRQRRNDSEETLTKFRKYIQKRKEIDQVRQELREEDMDAVCSICKDGDVTPDNQILFCESCNVAIHQQCYGVEKIPEGDYYCIACRHYERDKMIQSMSETSRLQARAELPRLPLVCELCPFKDGAFTQVETAKTASNPSDAKWVHMTCAKWQGLDFVEKGNAALVEDVTLLKQFYRRKNISCCICKGMRGAYTQCRQEGCDNWCHITCARESGLCEVVHGEDVDGVPIDKDPWTILCPQHSKVDKKQKNVKCIEDLVKAAKEFPVEPMPPPLLSDLAPYNKLTGEERKMALSVKEYEEKYIADILKTKLAGVRCEVCDIIEDIHGRNLSRCEDCGVVVCHNCELFSDNPGQRSFKCYACVARSTKACETEPQCSMCNQKGGLLVKCTARPMNFKKGYWNKNPKEFERSLFEKAKWAHVLCSYWLKDVTVDYNAHVVNLSDVIAANGRHFILNGNRCGLCGMKHGYKAKCATGRCHAHGELNKPYHFHATCARQIGFEVAHTDDEEFVVNCYAHGSNENNLRARLEDLIETEKKRAGKDFSRADAPMKFSDGSKLLHGAIMVMRVMGWAWRWAEWWVEYGSTWEPLLEEGEDESKMTARQLRIYESTKRSRMDDARQCRLSAFGAALRNRCYDTEDGFDNDALERALKAVLHTPSLVGPLEEYEIAFFIDLLGRAYRSKSRLLGFGEDRIPVANEAFCLHADDQSPKFELGNRPLPGKQTLLHGQIFEDAVDEPDDFLKYGDEVTADLLEEIDYKYKGNLIEDVDYTTSTLMATIDTDFLDKDKSYILKQRRGRIPQFLRLAVTVKIAGHEFKNDDSKSGKKATTFGAYKVDEELMNFDKEGFGPMQANKVAFLQHVGIKSVDEFMKAITRNISEPYIAWREKNGFAPLKDVSSAGNVLNKWKSDIRKYYLQYIGTGDNEAAGDCEAPDDSEITQPTQDQPEMKSSPDQKSESEPPVQVAEVPKTVDKSKSKADAAGLENARTPKRSRTQQDNREIVSESKQEEDETGTNDDKVEGAPRNKRAKLQRGRQSLISSTTTPNDTAKTPNSVTRPRRTNFYKEGSLKEAEDDINDPDSADTEFNREVSVHVLSPAKKKRSIPPSSVRDSEPTPPKRTKSTKMGPLKRRPGRPPKVDKFFSALPEEGVDFLGSLGVRTSVEFLTSNTSNLAATYPKYRVQTKQKPLKGGGALSKISTWKRLVRDAAAASGDIELANIGYNRNPIGIQEEESDEDEKCALCNDGGELIVCDGCEKAYHATCVDIDEIPEGDWFCPRCSVEDDDKCAICNGVGELIVCDGCEKAYHTKCVDLDEIPEGDWFCPGCSAEDDDKCALCNDVGELIVCDGCEKAYHIECVELSEVPEGDWFCPSCNTNDDDDKCAICNDVGELIVCDGCEKAYHIECVELSEVPEGDWFCALCKK